MSGLIQGSVLGPTFYVMLSNSLLSANNLPLEAFADDFKFLADVTYHTKNEVQAEIDMVSDRVSRRASHAFVYRKKQCNALWPKPA